MCGERFVCREVCHVVTMVTHKSLYNPSASAAIQRERKAMVLWVGVLKTERTMEIHLIRLNEVGGMNYKPYKLAESPSIYLCNCSTSSIWTHKNPITVKPRTILILC